MDDKLNKQTDGEDILQEDMECSSEEILNQVALQEELKRIDLQDNPTSKISKNLKEHDDYLESVRQAHIIGECLQILLGYGVDYNNSISIANNIVQNRVNLETSKMQQMQAQNVQL